MEGLILSLNAGQYTVMDIDTKEQYVCKARGKLRHMKVDSKSSFNENKYNKSKLEKRIVKLSPKVGDKVTFDLSDDEIGVNYINEVKPRINDIKRPAVVNINKALLIFSAKQPDFSFNLLDRFLIHIEYASITPVIVVSKIDLLSKDELEELKNKLKYYSEIGYSVHFTSSEQKIGLEELQKEIDDNINILAGQTGAGKSSLLNAIDPTFAIATQEISKSLGRGKHTTRHSTLHIVNGGFIADTPGFSSLEFGKMNVEDLVSTYVDFNELSSSCKYRGCTHISEPGCAVKEEMKNNDGLKDRYNGYLKFVDQLKMIKVKY